ncbi:MAG TPA: hypothetical protein VFP65_02200 [Anaeromyxobacteraceae bacterium]|nr:hypothetical protein [Anaeromyxobacteraceae bacterium]
MTEPATATAAAPPAGSPRRQLRNYLLDPGLQLRLAGYLVAVAAALSAVLGWQIWRAYAEASKLVALGDPRSDEAISAMLHVEDRARMLWMAAVLGGVLVCLLVLAVVVTHRIAGPALALARACRSVAEGRLAPPRPLRRGDLLAGLAEEVGAMVGALRAREAEEQRRLEAAARATGDEAREVAAQLAAEKARRLGP